MRGMAKVPGSLEAMKPMFRALPQAAARHDAESHDKMLELVAAKVPMPDYMAEQMPQMMPKVMDNSCHT